MKFVAKTDALKAARANLPSSPTQEDMVDLLKAATGQDYQRTYYTLVENGDRRVQADMALAIARILNVSVDDVFISEELAKKEEAENASPTA